jgi:hypothetical protein
MPMLPACSSPPGLHADPAAGVVSVLDIAPPRYDPAGARGDGPALAADCRQWSLTRRQAENYFRLSKPVTLAETHAFDTLPCTISGTLRADGRTWTFEINAGATAIWRSGTELRMFGCTDLACAPLVRSMPNRSDE